MLKRRHATVVTVMMIMMLVAGVFAVPLATWAQGSASLAATSCCTQVVTFNFSQTTMTVPLGMSANHSIVSVTVVKPDDATGAAWRSGTGQFYFDSNVAANRVANSSVTLPHMVLNATAGWIAFYGLAAAWVHIVCATSLVFTETVTGPSAATTTVQRSFSISLDTLPIWDGTLGVTSDAFIARFGLTTDANSTSQSFADLVSAPLCGKEMTLLEGLLGDSYAVDSLYAMRYDWLFGLPLLPLVPEGYMNATQVATTSFLHPDTFASSLLGSSSTNLLTWTLPLFWAGGEFNGSVVTPLAGTELVDSLVPFVGLSTNRRMFGVGSVWAQDPNTTTYVLANATRRLNFDALTAKATQSVRLYSACIVTNMSFVSGVARINAQITWPSTTAAPTTTTPPTTTTTTVTAAPTAPSTTITTTTTTAAASSTPAQFTIPLVTTAAPVATTSASTTSQTRKAQVLQGSTITVTDIYSNYDPDSVIVTIQVVNDSWIPNFAVANVIMTGTYPRYLQPHGFNGAVVSQQPSIYQYAVSVSGAMLNITFANNKCYFPSVDELITVQFLNYSTVSGSAVSSVSFFMAAATSQMDSDSFSGLVMVSITVAALGFLFLLDAWCEVVVTLTQLQCLAMLALTTCAPPGLRAIFESSQWLLWPTSDRVQNSTSPDTAQRLAYFFIIVGVTLVFNLVAFGLFNFFSEGAQHPAERARFPGAFLFVLYSNLPGAVFAATLAFVPEVTGDYTNTGGNITVAVFAAIACFSAVVSAAVAVIRVVASLEYRDSAAIHIGSFWKRLFFGGAWVSKDGMVLRWGVIFDNMSGSGFWFFAAHVLIVAFISTLTAFTPVGVDGCSRQYGVLTAAFATNAVFMFVRRPFKSVYLNFLNMGVSALSTLIAIAFATSMTCSRKGMTFAYFALWFGLVLIMVKSVATLLLVGTEQFINVYRTAGAIQQERSPASPTRRLMDPSGKLRIETDAVELQFLNVGAQGQRGLGNSAYKPSIPVPLSIGPCIVCREVGFGQHGGLDGNSGPSVGVQLHQPTGLCMDGTSALYVLDTGAHRVLRHDLLSRTITTIAGVAGVPGYSKDASSGTNVRFNSPRGACVGQACLFIADTNNDCIRRLDFASGTVHTVLGAGVGNTVLSRPHSVATIGSMLYVADTLKHRVIAMHLSGTNSSNVKPVMGTGFPGYSGIDTVPVASQLNNPQGLAAYDEGGELYIVDTGNHRVMRYSTITQHASLVIGTPGVAGESHTPSKSMLASTVQLCLPTDVAVWGQGSERQVFVVDGGNTKIWRVNRLGYAQVVLPPCDEVAPRCIVAVRRPAKVVVADERQLSSDASYHLLGGSNMFDEVDDEAVLYASDALNNLVASIRVSAKPGPVTFDADHLEAMRNNPMENHRRVPEVWQSDWDGPSAIAADGGDLDRLVTPYYPAPSLAASTRGGYDSDAPSRQPMAYL